MAAAVKLYELDDSPPEPPRGSPECFALCS